MAGSALGRVPELGILRNDTQSRWGVGGGAPSLILYAKPQDQVTGNVVNIRRRVCGGHDP